MSLDTEDWLDLIPLPGPAEESSELGAETQKPSQGTSGEKGGLAVREGLIVFSIHSKIFN